ncbi:hypothetical protein LTR08_009023 [Meristemomyces frigidus]|nr:hypothetical protein LTR08_009023 [Meristemomyces frigidus]
MFKTFTIDPTPLKDQILKMIESCMEAALQQTKAVLDGVPQSPPPSIKVVHKELTGLRDQIMANAALLLPILRPETNTAASGRNMAMPELYVITSGVEPSLRALVVYGYHGDVNMTKFMYGDKASTATEALENLLAVTMALTYQEFDDKNYDEAFAVSVKGGGYITAAPKASPIMREDALFWGSSTVPSPEFPTNASFRSVDSSESESERIYLDMRSASAHASANHLGVSDPSVTGSFRSNSSTHLTGGGMDVTFRTVSSFDGNAINGGTHMNGAGSTPCFDDSYFNGTGVNGAFKQQYGFHGDGISVKRSSKRDDSFQGNAAFCGNNIRMYDGSDGNVKMKGWQ